MLELCPLLELLVPQFRPLTQDLALHSSTHPLLICSDCRQRQRSIARGDKLIYVRWYRDIGNVCLARWRLSLFRLSDQLPASLRTLLELDLGSCAEEVLNVGEVIKYGHCRFHGSAGLVNLSLRLGTERLTRGIKRGSRSRWHKRQQRMNAEGTIDELFPIRGTREQKAFAR